MPRTTKKSATPESGLGHMPSSSPVPTPSPYSVHFFVVVCLVALTTSFFLGGKVSAGQTQPTQAALMAAIQRLEAKVDVLQAQMAESCDSAVKACKAEVDVFPSFEDGAVYPALEDEIMPANDDVAPQF